MKRKLSKIIIMLILMLSLILGTTYAYTQSGLALGIKAALKLGEGESEQTELNYAITIGKITLEYANLPENIMQKVTIPVTTENIPANTVINVKLVKEGLDIDTEEYTIEGNTINNNSATIILNLGNELEAGEYYVELSYVEKVIDETTGEIVSAVQKASSNTTFTISQLEVKSIHIEDEIFYMNKGESQQLTYTVVPKGIKDSDLLFESENENVAIIEEGGAVRATGRGITSVKILSKDRKIVDTCQVSVTEKAIEITEFKTIPEVLVQGEEQEINVKVTLEDYEIGSVLDVFILKNGEYVTNLFEIYGNEVNSDNLDIIIKPIDIHTISSGTYTIQITYNEEPIEEENTEKQTRTFNVTSKYPVTGIVGEENVIYMTPNSQRTLQLSIVPENASNVNLVYNVEKSEIAEIDSLGRITSKNMGITQVNVYSEENPQISRIIELRVIDLVESEEYTVDLEKGIIKDIPVNTNMEDFLSNIQVAGDYEIYTAEEFSKMQEQENYNSTENENSNRIEDEEVEVLVKTGMVLLVNGNKIELVVRGDTNGDGIFDIVDLSRTVLHIVEKSKLEGTYKMAADVRVDEELKEGEDEIDIMDLAQMVLALVGKQNL
ncbi:MAG: Ig-like domain-containing protein [Clostridia bacterium]|nr:Ig-like domain-containing protein [Clostridia bacterium]